MQAKLILLTVVTMGVGAMMVSPHDAPALKADGSISVSNLGPTAGETVDLGPAPSSWLSISVDAGQTERERYVSQVSDEDAIKLAMARGAELLEVRETRAPHLQGLARSPGFRVAQIKISDGIQTTSDVNLSAKNPEVANLATAASLWRVTGSRVNLRAGPSTNDAVVGVALSGEAMIPTSDTSGDWIEVQRDTGESAWIFARFLEPSDI